LAFEVVDMSDRELQYGGPTFATHLLQDCMPRFACKAHDRVWLEQLCRYVTRPFVRRRRPHRVRPASHIPSTTPRGNRAHRRC
jgi:hypothetical protein